MSKVDIVHYNMDELLTHNADINIIWGERSNGKSYQVKHKRAIINYLETGNRFMYVRRLREEVTAEKVEQYFKDVDIEKLNLNFHIHCDIGHKGKTKELIKEITNWVESLGYDCLIKPESYTASGIANKFSK